MTTPRRVTSDDGVALTVFETGPADAPPLVAVHGYPDNHTVWARLVERLTDRFRMITYDVRGAGDPDQPGALSAYRMPRLVADLAVHGARLDR